MIENEFDSFVELKIQGLVSLIVEHEHLVFEVLLNEKQTNELTYPDFV